MTRLTAGSIIAAALGAAALTSGLAPAAADPGLPADPLVPAPAPAPAPAPQDMIGQALAQLSQSSPLNPLNALNDVPVLLGQAALPPGAIGGGPAADPLALAESLMPQNYRMPTPDQMSPYALAPNTTPSPFARIDAWKGVHALLHGGLGRMPGDELGQPLPGTAPPPDSNLPPGLEQFYIPAPPVG